MLLRSETDLEEVKAKFIDKYSKSLAKWVKVRARLKPPCVFSVKERRRSPFACLLRRAGRHWRRL